MAEAAFKPEKDFTKEVDELLPQAEELAKAGPFPASALWELVLSTDTLYRPTCKPPSKSSLFLRNRLAR